MSRGPLSPGVALAIALALAFCGRCALAGGTAAGDAEPASVEVNAMRSPEMRSYRSVWAGLDAFDAHHALAPQAPLRFRMLRADGSPAEASDGLALRLAGDDGSVSLPIAADGSFTVPRERALFDADASFVLNKKRGRYQGRPDVRTPGLPAGVRRLGDLRLECRVLTAIAKEDMSFMARAAITALTRSGDWCGKDQVKWSYPAGPQLAGALLRFGERSQELELNGANYLVPIGDASWPDDALVELRFDAPPA